MDASARIWRREWVTGAVVMLALILLGGCGGPMVFHKPGATPAELQRDAYLCRQAWERSAGAIAFRHDPLGNAVYGVEARAEQQRCLEHKGWTRVNDEG